MKESNVVETTDAVVKTKDVNVVTFGKAKGISDEVLAVEAIKDIFGTAKLPSLKNATKVLTPFGHDPESQGGMIDMNILSGHTTLQGLAMGLYGSATRKSDPEAYGKSCLRVKNHVKWMATGQITHGGIGSRVARVHKNYKMLTKRLSKQMAVLLPSVEATFKAKYNSQGIPLS